MVTLFVSGYEDTTVLGSPGVNSPVVMDQPYLVGPYQPMYASYVLMSVVGGTGSTGTTNGIYTSGMAKINLSGVMEIFYTPDEDGFPLNGNRAGWKPFTVSYITMT